ncbi:MAG: serine hydrolase [Pseudomonadota bacterium]
MTKRSPRNALFAGLLLTCTVGPACAQDGTQLQSAPLGLWSWSAEENDHELLLSLEIVNGSWNATVDGATAATMISDGEISVSLPDGQKFVGELNDDRSEIHGHWFQPPSPLDYQYMATPVVLPAAANDRWQAEIKAQPRPFRLILDVFQDEENQTAAVLRNPSGNNTLGASRFRVEAEASGGWSLVSGSGGRERRHRLYSSSDGEVLLQYDRFDEPISLAPASDTAKSAYYSRLEDEGAARFNPPPQLDDGWLVATPEEAGFDGAALEALTGRIATLDPRREYPHLIHSLLVARGGKLAYEEYFYGHDREKRHDVRSLGKSFGSVMVGALQAKGHAITADHRPVASLLQSTGLPVDDQRKADITLGNLMTFTSGLDCDVNSDSAGSEGRMWEQQEERNYWLYTAKLDMLHDPGTRYAYCSGSANLVGASLSAFGKAPVYELFDELIAKPLDFGPYHFTLAPNGEGYLGGGAYMRPRDILKIGAMFAAGGVWNGKRIVSEGWVEESTTPRVEVTPETTGMTQEVFQNSYFGGSQAYIWGVDFIEVGERRYASYQASGNGGQLLIVVPELNLVVGFTGGNYRMGGVWGRWRDFVVGRYIIPAITDLP